ncbi:MAG: hypothetical protein ACRDJG_00535 [Actinomycetota bacterium]
MATAENSDSFTLALTAKSFAATLADQALGVSHADPELQPGAKLNADRLKEDAIIHPDVCIQADPGDGRGIPGKQYVVLADFHDLVPLLRLQGGVIIEVYFVVRVGFPGASIDKWQMKGGKKGPKWPLLEVSGLPEGGVAGKA